MFAPVFKIGELEMEILMRTVRPGTSESTLNQPGASLEYLLAAKARRVVTREKMHRCVSKRSS
jgi:DNA-binding response OmpR family regulator